MPIIFHGLCLLLVSLAYLSNAEAETRLALVIGNEDYSSSAPWFSSKVPSAIREALAMERFLKKAKFNVTLITDANHEKMMKTVDDFMSRLKAAAGDGVGLVYYAGHGIQFENQNYLIPSGAQIDSLAVIKTRAYPLDEIIQYFKQTKNRLNILIVDACRTAPPAFRRGADDDGLVVKAAPQGQVIAYAAGSGRPALDGLYTPILLQHMETPDLPFREVLYRTARDVTSRNPNQEPFSDFRAFNMESWTILPREPEPPRKRHGWLGITWGPVPSELHKLWAWIAREACGWDK